MSAIYPNPESDDLYTRDFLVRIPNLLPQDSRHHKGHRLSASLPLVVSCLSIAAMVVYQLTRIRVIAWDFNIWILVLFTGAVSFAMTHIFVTLFFGED